MIRKPTEAELHEKLSFLEHSFPVVLEDGDGKRGGSYSEMYQASYMLVFCAKGSELYELVSQAMERRARQIAGELAMVSMNLVVSTFNADWKKYNDGVALIDDALMYMNRVYLPRTSLESIKTLGTRIFREALAEYLRESQFADNWEHSMTNGVSVNDEQKQFAHTMQELFKQAPEFYASFFEMPLQRAAVKVYREKAVKHLNENGTEGFSEAVEEWVLLEAPRAAVFVREGQREGHMTAVTDLMLLADPMYQRPDA